MGAEAMSGDLSGATEKAVPQPLFRPFGAAHFPLLTQGLPPWAVFLRRFAAFLFSLLPTAYAVG